MLAGWEPAVGEELIAIENMCSGPTEAEVLREPPNIDSQQLIRGVEKRLRRSLFTYENAQENWKISQRDIVRDKLALSYTFEPNVE